jgi:hypothetical protein
MLSLAKYTLLINLLLLSHISHAQLVNYSFTGAAGNEATFPPDNQPVNGTASNMSRGAGITPSASANTFSASGFSTTGIDLNDYFAFSIQPNAGFQLIINRIDLTNAVASQVFALWLFGQARTLMLPI